LHPWKGKILAGTYHAPWHGPRSDNAVSEEHLHGFLADLNKAIPGFDLTAADVLRVHWGYLPAAEEGSEALASREVFVDHGDAGGPRGLFSVSGVKFTTARRVAQKTLRMVLPGRRFDVSAHCARPTPAAVPSLALLEDWLGNGADADPERAAREIRRLLDTEAVVHLDDLVLRRTDWGMDPRAGREIAARVAPLLGWEESRIRADLAHLDKAVS
jgi:glycerol-3-phosphate dehydrogenase